MIALSLLLSVVVGAAAAAPDAPKPDKPAASAKTPPKESASAQVIKLGAARSALSSGSEGALLKSFGYKLELVRKAPGPGNVRRAPVPMMVIHLNDAEYEREGKRWSVKRGTVVSIDAGAMMSGTILSAAPAEFIMITEQKEAPSTKAPEDGGAPLRSDAADLAEPKTGDDAVRALSLNSGRPTAFSPSLLFVRRPMTRRPPFKPDTLWFVLSGKAKLKLGETERSLAEDDIVHIPANYDKAVRLIPESGTVRLIQLRPDQSK